MFTDQYDCIHWYLGLLNETHPFENIMPNYTEISIAVIFLLLSIFVTYPIPSLLRYVNAAAGSQTPCGEWKYYDKEGRCRSCEIPCGISEEECWAHGCLACKPDEYLETTLGKCRPCSIPCSMSAEQCQAVGCTVTTPRLPTPDLPPIKTLPDHSGPPIFATTTPDPDNSDPTGSSTIWMAIVFPIMALAIVTGCAVFWGKRLHVKYKRIGRRKLTPWQRRVLTILETCQNIYERIFPPNTRNEQRDAYDGGPRSDHPLLHQGPPAVPDRDPESLAPTRGTTPAKGANPVEDGNPAEGSTPGGVSAVAVVVFYNSQRCFSPPQLKDIPYIDEDYADDDQSNAGTADDGSLQPDDRLIKEVSPGGDPAGDLQNQEQCAEQCENSANMAKGNDQSDPRTADDGGPRPEDRLINRKSPDVDPAEDHGNLEQGATPAKGAIPAAGAIPAKSIFCVITKESDAGTLDDGSPRPDDRLNEEVFPGERPEILQQSAISAEGANYAESATPAKDNDQSDPRTADDSGPQSDDRLIEDVAPSGDPKVLEQGTAPAEDATPAECANSESNDQSHAVTADDGNSQPGDRLANEESPGGDPAGDHENQEQGATPAKGANSAEDGTSTKDNDQSETGTADDGGPRSKDKQINEVGLCPGGDPAGDPKNLEEGSTPDEGSAPAEGQNPAEGNGLRDPRAADDSGPRSDVMLTNDESPGGDHAEDPDEGANPDEDATPAEEKQRKLNNTLAGKLDNRLDPEQFEKLKGWLKGSHGINDVRAIGKAKYPHELIELLINDKKIEIGELDGYKLLIEGLELFNEQVLADMVKDYQLQIANAGNP